MALVTVTGSVRLNTTVIWQSPFFPFSMGPYSNEEDVSVETPEAAT